MQKNKIIKMHVYTHTALFPLVYLLLLSPYFTLRRKKQKKNKKQSLDFLQLNSSAFSYMDWFTLFFVCVDLPGFSCRDRHSFPLFFFGSLLSKPERNQRRSSTSPSRTKGKGWSHLQLVCFKVPVSLTKVPSSVTKCNHDLPLPIQRAKGLIVEQKHYCRNYRVGWGGGHSTSHTCSLNAKGSMCSYGN